MERAKILSSFVKLLRDEKVLDFDPEDFDSRLRLQKYVFIARKFGLNLGYNFSMYIRGPYSPDLADDYYSLPSETEPLPEFDKEGFLNLVKDKDSDWLEASATILMICEDYDLNWAIERTAELKPWISKEKIEKVVEDLRKAGLIS
jgi:uncharacterized protein YwgA